MTTRREALKGAMGAGMVAIGTAVLPTAATAAPAPEAFDFDRYEALIAGLTVSAGLHDDGYDAVATCAVKTMFWYGIVPEGCEHTRDQCRAALLAVLARLEGAK